MNRTTIALLLGLLGTSIQAEDAFDPFSDSCPRISPSKTVSNEAQHKIIFICVSGGTLEGEALDARVKSIVIAISRFREAHERVPKGIVELIEFCKKEGLELHDLRWLTPVDFVDGTFKYSAGYDEGKLHLSHISDYYLTSDMLEPKKAEQAGSGQPATRPESKLEGSDKPQPEAEGRTR